MEYIICFIKISEVNKKDPRIPSEMIEAVYKVTALDRNKAKIKANELFKADFSNIELSDYIISCGSESLS